jgi:hypothetical protein
MRVSTTTAARPPAPRAADPFTATISPVAAAQLPFTYRAGCPVAPAQLRLLRVGYWGFDDRPHVGVIVVGAAVAVSVVSVFRTLYDERFPIREMRLEDDFGGSDPKSMAADNTSGFNCRDAVASGPPKWSAHAYGTAIDVNPVENPYVEGGAVQPAAGARFADRTFVRAGMSEPDGMLNRAFAAIGWQWGGRWTATPDYQHFSATGG